MNQFRADNYSCVQLLTITDQYQLSSAYKYIYLQSSTCIVFENVGIVSREDFDLGKLYCGHVLNASLRNIVFSDVSEGNNWHTCLCFNLMNMLHLKKKLQVGVEHLFELNKSIYERYPLVWNLFLSRPMLFPVCTVNMMFTTTYTF